LNEDLTGAIQNPMPEPVSVIVTCYNLERFIGEAIQSVVDQDYEGSVEIIVVDDCSTDGSAAIVRQFHNVVLVQPAANGGVLNAMNLGINRARHDLLMMLDGDDIWEPTKIRLVAQVFAADPAVNFVTHDIRCIDGEGNWLAIPSRPAAKMPLIPKSQVSDRLREGVLAMDDFICLGAAVSIRRSRSDISGFLEFCETLPDASNTYQDWPLAGWCAVQCGARFAYVPEPLYRYRIHQDNHSGDARTPERALRNLRRTLNTIDALHRICRDHAVDLAIAASLERRRYAISYLITLYGGSRLDALAAFWKALPDLRRRRLVAKELIRLAGIQLLGRRKFAGLAGRRRILRHLPAT
jgi:glycosyltransferase involved in cell wall biosynthesis